MSEQPTPTREQIKREAIALEVVFDSADDLWLRKGDLFCYCTQDNTQGRVLAMEWLAQLRRSMEERDAHRSLEVMPRRRLRARWLWGRETNMTHCDTLTSETRPTISVDGLEVEVFATEEEAQAAFATVPSNVEQQAAACVAQTVRGASTC